MTFIDPSRGGFDPVAQYSLFFAPGPPAFVALFAKRPGRRELTG